MNRRPALTLLLLTALLAACATTPRLRYDRDPSFDVAAARTFSFLEPLGTDRDGYSTLLSQRLVAVTRRELEARGYRYVRNDPDLLVNFGARLDERVRSTVQPVGFAGYYGYRRGLYGGWLGYEERVDGYREGTLNIDVVDPGSMRLVWEGVAVGRVTEATLEDAARRTEEAVVEILEAFPEQRPAPPEQRPAP